MSHESSLLEMYADSSKIATVGTLSFVLGTRCKFESCFVISSGEREW